MCTQVPDFNCPFMILTIDQPVGDLAIGSASDMLPHARHFALPKVTKLMVSADAVDILSSERH